YKNQIAIEELEEWTRAAKDRLYCIDRGAKGWTVMLHTMNARDARRMEAHLADALRTEAKRRGGIELDIVASRIFTMQVLRKAFPPGNGLVLEEATHTALAAWGLSPYTPLPEEREDEEPVL